MKLTVIPVLFISCILLFSCRKDSQPMALIAWGEAASGLQLSLNIDDRQLSEGDAGMARLIVRNVSDQPIAQELFATLNLYGKQEYVSFLSYFDLMADNLNALYRSSMEHPQTDLFMEAGGRKEFRIDITNLGWVKPVDSRPPYETFYKLIPKDEYLFKAELHLSSGGQVQSNTIQLTID